MNRLHMSELSRIKYFLLIIIFVAGIFRLYGLSEESFWGDETYTANMAKLSSEEIIIETLKDVHPPLYLLLMKFWVSIAGDSEKALRLPGAIAGILGVFIAYLLGKEIFGKNVGLMTSLFYAGSYLQIYYAQEARVYVFFLLCSAASIWSYFCILRNNYKIHAILFIITSLLTLNLHLFGIWVLFSLAIHFLIYGWIIPQWRSRWKTILSSFFVIVLMYFPVFIWGVWRSARLSNEGFWADMPDFVEVMRTLVQFLPFYIPPFSPFETPILNGIFQENVLLISNAILLSFFTVGMCILIIKTVSSNKSFGWKYNLISLEKVIFVIILSLGTFSMVLIFSYLVVPVWVKRFLLYASIPILSLCAYMLLNLFPARCAWFLALLFFIGSCGISVSHHFIKDKISWREAVLHLRNNYQEGDIIATFPKFGYDPIRYYARKYDRTDMEERLSDNPYEIKAWLAYGNRLWLISRYGSRLDIKGFKNQIRKVSQFDFPLMHFKSAIRIELLEVLKPQIY